MANTYFVQDSVKLALNYKDPQEWFSINEIFDIMPVQTQKGEYRVDDELAWYQRLDFHMGPDGYPKSVDYGDSYVTWATEPLGRSYEINIPDLRDYSSRGYQSAEQMKQGKWQYLIHMAYINKELAGIAEITTDANYDSNNLHTQGAGDFAAAVATTGRAGLAWSNQSSTPINDVAFLKKENKRATTIAMSYVTFNDLMMHPQILDYGSITASDRDNMSPAVSKRYLEACFKLRVVIFMAEAVTSATADLPLASQAKGEVWGDYIWVGAVNKTSPELPNGERLRVPNWGLQWVYAPVSDNQGWIMNETIDKRAALTGKVYLDCGYYGDFDKYAYLYGQRLDGVN